MVDTQTYSDGGFRLERLANGWLVGRFAALEAIGVAHLVTTRQGPDERRVRHDPTVAGREVAEALGLEGAAFLEQVHGGEVLECEQAGCAGFGDGLVTARKGLALFGKSADCPIVLIADRGGQAVGFAHASWRATVAGITPAVVSRMVRLGCRPADLVACICPSAGPCCYEIGDEVRAAAIRGIGPHAAAFFRPAETGWQRQPQVADGSGDSHDAIAGACNSADGAQRGKEYFDLWLANADALARAGLRPESVHVAGVCTICRSDLFPSHRREGAGAGRFAAVIGHLRTSMDTAQA
jgi:YfiH family protein